MVYEAFDRERGTRVAVKMLRSVDAASLYRFKREFRTLSGLSHPNIVALYELVCEDERWYLSMELIEGVDFITFIRPPSNEEELDPSEVGMPFGQTEVTADTRLITGVPEVKPEFSTLVDEARLRASLGQLASATRALHDSGLVHRDLKPSNTRITGAGRLVLMDFGIAAAENERATIHGDATAGTPSYMAPEQAAGDRPTPAADWYAFGSMMYQAITGRLPFEGPRNQVLIDKQRSAPRSIAELVDGCPADLADLCMALLQRDPSHRPTGEQVFRRLGSSDKERTFTTRGTEGGRFVGREMPMARMLRSYRDVREGKSNCVLVVGAVGMGKSALLERFAHEVAAFPEDPADPLGGPPLVLRGRCHESESLAYRAFDDIIDGLTRHLVSLPDKIVADLLPRDADSLPRLFPVMRRVPAVRVVQPIGGLEGAANTSRAFAALKALFAALTHRGPVVIVIDDMQWADPSSLELIEHVLGPPAIQGLCLVLSGFPGSPATSLLQAVLGRVYPAASLSVLELAPLGEDDQRMIVALHAANDPHLSPDEQSVWTASEGNPLFLHEILRFVSEHPDRLNEWKALPAHERLNAALAARVEALADEPRRLLEAIAIAQTPLPARVLARAAGIGRDDAERAAAVLRVAGFAHSEQGSDERPLVVNHPRLTETVLSQLSEEATKQLHRQLADDLERWDDAPPAALAHHLLASGERSRGVHFLCEAAELADDKGDTERAVELLTAARDAAAEVGAPVGEIEAWRARLLMGLGRHRDAAEAFLRATDGATDSARAKYLQLRAENLLWSGDVDGGLAVFANVLKLYGRELPKTKGSAIRSMLATRVRLWWKSSQVVSRAAADIPNRVLARIDSLHAAATALTMLDPIKGVALQREHFAAALDAGEPQRLRRARALDAMYRAMREREVINDPIAEVTKIVIEARISDDPTFIATNLYCKASIEALAGNVDAAIESSAEGERVLSRVERRHSWERGSLRFIRLITLLYRGRFAEAKALLEDATTEAMRRGDRVMYSTYLSTPGVVVAIAAGPTAAEALERKLGVLIDEWDNDPRSLVRWRLRLAAANVCLALGKNESARSTILQLSADARSSGLSHIPWAMTNLHRIGLQLAIATNDRLAFEEQAEKLGSSTLPVMIAAIEAGEAAFAHARGDSRSATRMLSSALDRMVNNGSAHVASAYRTALAQIAESGATPAGGDQASQWATEQGITEPDFLFRYLAPGLISQ